MNLSRRNRRGIIVGLALLLVFAGLLGTAFLFPNQVLTVDSGPLQADVIVVLGGGGGERPARAAELVKAGEAPLVICSGLGDCTSNKKLVEKAGVAAAVVQTECESHNTSENARFTIPLLRQLGAKRVIIVTSWYHSRRALNCFEHYAPDLTFYSRPSYFAYAKTDWKPKGVEGYVRLEYLKNLGYFFRYGVWPF